MQGVTAFPTDRMLTKEGEKGYGGVTKVGSGNRCGEDEACVAKAWRIITAQDETLVVWLLPQALGAAIA